ncbi:Origin recognition complex subunit 2 [Ceratocystis pirilliformis]|uniref:Origin recognition complex subunit 2 n=1 Tax=Ceratocystis pirilliformis TaxID=259994 RepID=A0ABR3ZPZ2_9PEZI
MHRTFVVGGSPLKKSTTLLNDDLTAPPAASKGRRRAAINAVSRNEGLLSSSPERLGAAEDDSDGEFKTSPTVVAKPKRKYTRKATTTDPNLTATPSKKRSTARTPKTPTTNGAPTPRRRAAADQSARRKSMRTMIERANADDLDSDDERLGLAQHIYGSSTDSELGLGSNDDENEDEEDGLSEDGSATATPSRKRGRKGKASATKSSTIRKKPGRRAKEPTPEPPRDLPPHEMYFFHNKPGRATTSNATLGDLELLTPDEYFALARDLADPHAGDMAFLQALHEESFTQWAFELAEGFSICLFGMGSKRALMRRLAAYLARHGSSGNRGTRNRIVMVNGFARAITTRDLLNTVWASLEMSHRPASGQPAALLADTLHTLALRDETLTVLVNSVDASPMRKSGMQAALAALAASPHVQMVVSADSPDFAILWDVGQRSAFRFAFHDATTLAPFAPPEIEPVDEVHELLGRANRRIGGKEGVTFVLKSLTQNAKGLYLLLLAEVLAAMDDVAPGSAVENPVIEYRMLFNKAVEAFVCPSSEMAFRQLLKEFHDHQMITSTRDALGTELISTPFRREEMEAILEDIAS